ncbi:MAG: DnaA regulatory inactivator Hda [Halothiobacillaceae bacterium]|nr:MAG: DnaA regulatory inactivator Hda [Halothiobacillaceae bacterium]
MFQQQVLDFGLAPTRTLEQFVAGANGVAAGLVARQAEGCGEPQLYLWGATGSGKTHLLQAACQRAGECGMPAAYLALAEAPHPGVLEGLEQLGLVALDDVQAVIGEQVWDEALFDLINRLREHAVPLLLAADCPPTALRPGLKDLASRLGWGPVLRLEALDDDGKLQVLKRRASERGMDLPDEVGRYLLDHLPRDLAELLAGLDRLDRASMERQRRITLPLAREVLA